jgi:hypothetical protein
MDSGFTQVANALEDLTLALQAALAREAVGDDLQTEMTAFPCTGVSGVLGAVVEQLDRLRRQRGEAIAEQ